MKTNISQVRLATEKDIPAIKRITDECIGQDYYSEKDILEFMSKSKYYFYVYDKDGVPVAYLYIFTDRFAAAKDELHMKDGVREIEGITDDTIVGVYKTACTSTAYRNSGILTSFLNMLEDVLRDDGAEHILFTAIKHPSGKIPVDGVVRSVDFEPRFEIEHPWIEIESYCPYCGKDHCECNAVIYSKKII